MNIFGKSYHKKPVAGYTGSTTAILVSEIINAFAGNGIITGKGITGTQITGLKGSQAEERMRLTEGRPEYHTQAIRSLYKRSGGFPADELYQAPLGNRQQGFLYREMKIRFNSVYSGVGYRGMLAD